VMLRRVLLLLAVAPGSGLPKVDPNALTLAQQEQRADCGHRCRALKERDDGGASAHLWDEYTSKFTLDTFTKYVQCAVDNTWSINHGDKRGKSIKTHEYVAAHVESAFYEDQPPEDFFFHFPIPANETSKVKKNILLEKMVGGGSDEDPCFVIMSVKERMYLATKLVDQLIESGAKGKIMVVNGVHLQDKTNDKLSRQVVQRGWRDHGLPIVYQEGGKNLHLFFEDDAMLCTTDVNVIVNEAKKAPIMWIGYNDRGNWGAQLWSLWREAIPDWHYFLTYMQSGHYDGTLRETSVPLANRSWACGRPHDDGMHSGTDKAVWDCDKDTHQFERSPFEHAQSVDAVGHSDDTAIAIHKCREKVFGQRLSRGVLFSKE